jgi:hypothetical protein
MFVKASDMMPCPMVRRTLFQGLYIFLFLADKSKNKKFPVQVKYKSPA